MLGFSQSSSRRTKKPAGGSRRAQSPMLIRGLAERCETACQTRKLARCGVLVEHPASDAAEQFRLDPRQRRFGLVLIARGKRRFDLLDKGADAADPRPIDLGAAGIAADAFLCLRRIG